MTDAYRPASIVLGVCSNTGAALVVDGRLAGVRLGNDGEQWPARLVEEVLAHAGVDGQQVEHLAVALPPGRLTGRVVRSQTARLARRALGPAAFVGVGRMGTSVLRRRDGRDRVTGHDQVRCLAAAVGYTAGWRDSLVVVGEEGRLRLFRATSGKLAALGQQSLGGDVVSELSDLAQRLRIDHLALVGRDLGAPALPEQLMGQDGIAAVWRLPIQGPGLGAVGAALVAWADERQGAWVPTAFDPAVLEGGVGAGLESDGPGPSA